MFIKVYFDTIFEIQMQWRGQICTITIIMSSMQKLWRRYKNYDVSIRIMTSL